MHDFNICELRSERLSMRIRTLGLKRYTRATRAEPERTRLPRIWGER